MIVHGRLLADAALPPERGWIEIDGDRITDVRFGDPPGDADLGGPEAIVCPGFIDAHLHLPQIDVIGFDGMPLLEWLDRVVFPAEHRWSDAAVAREQAIAAHARLLAAGTLGYAGFLTSHTHALDAAVSASRMIPLRARAGQVLMDRGAPDPLLGHAIASPPADGERLEASVNPRFAVACSHEMLCHAATLAGDTRFVQTHLAETAPECAAVAELFPDDTTYTAVYGRRDLLGPRTLLAHVLHLTEPEWADIASHDAVVVHCPTANTFLEAGVFDLATARRHGVRLALGSDVAAGWDFAMPRVARAMIDVARTRRLLVDPDAYVPTAAEAWTMITRGNADALAWPDAGRLEPGAAADVLVLDVPFAPDGDLVSRLLYNWDESMIAARVLAGQAFP